MTDTRKISRRTVAKGIAWSVPAVAVATATPALAASGGGPTLTLGNACKNPGNSCKTRPKGYTVFATICNPTGYDIYVTGVTYTTTGTTLDLTYAPPPTLPFLVPKGECVEVYLNASSTNSANQEFTLNVTLAWSHTPDPADDDQQGMHQPVTQSVLIPGTPPDCVCPPGDEVPAATTLTTESAPAPSKEKTPAATESPASTPTSTPTTSASTPAE